MVNTTCVYAAFALLAKAGSVFAPHLNLEEIQSMLDGATQSFGEFMRSYFIGFGKGAGISVEEALKLFDEAPWKKK